MGTFVLVHGAWHGGWCWDRLVAELRSRGHASVTMDLPVGDGSATFDDYARVVTEAAAGAGDDAVLVGHSLGAMVIPLVAARRTVRTLVFLCGVVPNLGGSPWDDAPPMAEPGTYDGLIEHPDGSTSWPTLETARRAFYHDCRPEDAAWAFSRLRPQNPSSLWDRPYPLTDWPPGRRVAIIGADDAAVTVGFGRHVARARLGVEPVEIDGGHSPFLARPAELADLLTRI